MMILNIGFGRGRTQIVTVCFNIGKGVHVVLTKSSNLQMLIRTIALSVIISMGILLLSEPMKAGSFMNTADANKKM